MKKRLKLLGSVLLFFGMSSTNSAQITLQVVTKNIEKTFDYKENYVLHILGEKANVSVDTWEEDKIKISIELSAKHPQRAVAESELNFFKYVMERIGKNIYVRNFIALPQESMKPKSKFKAQLKLIVPKRCEVNLTNKFGVAEVNGLEGSLEINSHFCQTELDSLSGKIVINTEFGNIKGKQLSGTININATRSDITLTELQGDYTINAKYGVIRINANEDLLNLNIDAIKTDIHFFNRELGRYQYALLSDHGEITIPESITLELDQISNFIKKVFSLKDQKFNVKIETSFGDIILSETKQQ